MAELLAGIAILAVTSAVTAAVLVTAARWLVSDRRAADAEAPARDAADMLAREIRQATRIDLRPDPRVWPDGTLLLHVYDPLATDTAGRRGQARWVSYHLEATRLVRRLWLPETYDPAAGTITMAAEQVARRGLSGFTFAWQDPRDPRTLTVTLQVPDPRGGQWRLTLDLTPRVVGSG